ncbi:hypothetical protein QUC31_014486 [Theobroma cacao]
MNMLGFLTPILRERYHLNNFSSSGWESRGKEELFNYQHSSLRNVIERCFGVLKTCFNILKKMLPYPMKTQKYLSTACCAVHNFIRMNG